MHTLRTLGAGLVVTIALGTVTTAAASAANTAADTPVSTPGTSWEDLGARAARDGTVPVVVALRTAGAEQPVPGANKAGTGRANASDRDGAHFRRMRDGLLKRFRVSRPR
jgi:hypothetical protein